MLTSLKILLADDETDNDLFFNHSLRRLNLEHKIIYAKNADELFQALEQESDLDLAIIDIRMPEKDGKECLREMKAHSNYRKIPVIIMTNSKNEKDVEEAYNAGAHYYVIKPYSLSNYVESIRLIFNIDWRNTQEIPAKENFVINNAFV